MRRLKISCFTVLLMYTLTVSVAARDLFAIKTALTTLPEAGITHNISMGAGDVLEFSVRDIERRLSLREGELRGATLITVPALSQGGLFVDGVLLESYEFLDRGELDRLCFVPGDASSGATFSFLPQTNGDTVAVSLAIRVLAAPNQPPEIEDDVCETTMGVAKTGFINAWDPEGGRVTLQLATRPQKGTVTIDGMQYTYTPYQGMSGSDSFGVCAVDELNAYSREATVKVNIEAPRVSFFYADMQTHPSSYAALKLREAGVWSGTKMGNVHLFQPNERLNRGEYILLLLSAANLSHTVAPTVNTGLPNDVHLPYWLKPYVRAAIDAGIISGRLAFNWSEIPTRAEATLMCARAANLTGVRDFDLTMPDAANIPDWAVHSYKELAAYRMLDLHDGYAHPNAALTNSFAADLVWQLYKHKNR